MLSRLKFRYNEQRFSLCLALASGNAAAAAAAFAEELAELYWPSEMIL